METNTPTQRLALFFVLLTCVLMFIFPPVGVAETYGRNAWYGYVFLFSDEMKGHITDWTRLLFQMLFVAVPVWYFVLRKRN